MKILNGHNGWLLIVAAVVLVGCGSASSSGDEYVGGGDDGESGGTGIISTADSPAAMKVGDLIAFDLEGGEVTIDFTGVNEASEFIMVAGNYDPSIASSIKIASDIVNLDDVDKMIGGLEDGADAEAADEYGAQEILSSWLRVAEQEMSIEKPASDLDGDVVEGLSKSVGVGSAGSFRVLNNIRVTSSYTGVDAVAACVGENVILYVDTRVGIDAMSADDIDDACDELDRLIGQTVGLVGDMSDVNGDERLSVLVTPQVNLLGGSMGGIIVGYFFGADLYARSDSNPVSNQQEIVYVIAPDPTGEYGPSISTNYFLEKILPGVVPHELQHAISYNQHVFVSGGISEESWLNEGMSHLIEDLVGYGNENPARYGMFLNSPSSTRLVQSSSPNLSERGAAYLFLQYLYEQSGDGAAFLKRLVNTDRTGVENIVAAYDGADENFDQFSELFAHWTVALAVSDRDINGSARFNYRERARDGISDNWKGVMIAGDVDDGRETRLDGVHLESLPTSLDQALESSSAGYFRIGSVPSWATLTAGGENDYAVLIRTE